MKLQVASRVVDNVKLGEGCYKLIFDSPRIAQTCLPGHFVHVQVNPFPFPLLRRAYSIYDTDGKSQIQIVFKVVGPGSLHLSRRRAEDEINLLGPLGNVFTPLGKDEVGLMVAGGLGIVPVYFYAKYLEARKDAGQMHFLYGAKNKSELYCQPETDLLESRRHYATDDGSFGFKGYLTQLLDRLIVEEKIPKEKIKIYCCGPEPMLAALSEYAVKNNLFCELSLEVGMPCGMGTCMGCVVRYNASNGGEPSFKRACWDGPIFKAGEVIFD